MNVNQDNHAFHYLGRITAVLELGARAHGEARWVHLYYALGFIPWAGLREPLQKHQQSILPALERKGTGDKYRQSLDSWPPSCSKPQASTRQSKPSPPGPVPSCPTRPTPRPPVCPPLPCPRKLPSTPRATWTSAACSNLIAPRLPRNPTGCNTTGTTTWVGYCPGKEQVTTHTFLQPSNWPWQTKGLSILNPASVKA